MLVGISGQAGSGKDTCADYLIKNYGFVRVAFADPMKRFVQDVFDFTDEQIWGPSEKRNAEDLRYFRGDGRMPHHLSPRLALQTLGTEWGRDCYPNVWVEYAIRVHEKLQGGGYAYDQRRGLYTVSYLMNAETSPMLWPRTNVVISDVRFKNEVEGIRKAGGCLVRVIREGAHGDVGVKGHASEEEQKSMPDEMFDAVIYNHEGFPAFHAAIEKILGPEIRKRSK
jgi:hypothetical protein